MNLMNARRGMMDIATAFPDAELVESMTTGELTINAETTSITIRHNLGKRPDVIVFWGDYKQPEDIPYGHCIRCIYHRHPFTSPNYTLNMMQYLYTHRHGTSGNILFGQSSTPQGNFSDTTATCVRGADPWAATDANGNPVTYKWCAIRFKESEENA